MTAPVVPFGLYIHWPFCRSKCPYCDFNSHAAASIDQNRWANAYLAEIGRLKELLPGRRLSSIFFGGGTPSLMEPETVAAMIALARAVWPHDGELEISLEANPTTAEAERFAALAQAGVNRLSIGVQSFDDAALRFLGRAHDANEARQAIELAQAAFDRVSFDLIYALPGQGRAEWRRQLDEALAFEPSHLSVYQLTIEDGTAFHRDGVKSLDDGPATALFELTQTVLANAGLPAYEISNHARRGAECRHNLAVWRGEDYAGMGPGAHGRLRLDGEFVATVEMRHPQAWLEAVERTGGATDVEESLTPQERATELLLLGLRLTEGVDAARFAEQCGLSIHDAVNATGLAKMIKAGCVISDGGGLRATDKGRRLLDAVLGELLG